MQQARAIHELIVAYTDAHHGAFPTGSSSTEIFQKLVDENHMQVRDTALFYIDMPGKVLATSTVLKAENVCFDVTLPLDGNLPDDLPVVFTTGYKIDYSPGKAAIPIVRSNLPNYAGVFCAGGNAYGIWADHKWSDQIPWYFLPDHSIANFISADYKPNGRNFQQLTPDGPLPP
jgi:hypothetical protein